MARRSCVLPTNRSHGMGTSLHGVWSATSSDAELIAAVRGGDSVAFGQLYQRHSGAARSVARQYSNSSQDAEDVVSDAFSKVFTVLQGAVGPAAALQHGEHLRERVRDDVLRVLGGVRVLARDRASRSRMALVELPEGDRVTTAHGGDEFGVAGGCAPDAMKTRPHPVTPVRRQHARSARHGSYIGS